MLSELLQKWLNISVLSVADKSVNNFIYWTTIPLGTCKEANSKPEGNMHVHEH